MFGFLGTIGHELQSLGGKAVDAVKDAVNDARNDPQLGGVISDTLNRVRSDLAQGVSRVGAGATTAAAAAIAPGGQGPITIPFTKQTLWLGGAALVLVIILVVLLWRRK